MPILAEHEEFVKEILSLASDDYYQFVYSFPTAFYAQRIEMSGLDRVERILDAGCGYGQWAVELAGRCERLEGIDINPNMIEIATRYAQRRSITNARFTVQSISSLSFPDNHFDFIWCWGVLMFGPIEDSLRELRRVLKPGGTILVGCLNARGRWLRKARNALFSNPVNWNLLKVCIDALMTGHRENVIPNYTTTSMAKRRCRASGLELIDVALDGHLDRSRERRVVPVFAPRYCFLEENIEFLARKSEY